MLSRPQTSIQSERASCMWRKAAHHCVFAGWPGSCADSTVFKEMRLAQHHFTRDYFEPGEYLIADSGYPADRSHNTIIPSYRKNSKGSDIEAFNTCVAHVRVVNERTIGNWSVQRMLVFVAWDSSAIQQKRWHESRASMDISLRSIT